MADVKRVENEVDLTPLAKGLISFKRKVKWDKEIFSYSYYIYTVLSHARWNYSFWTNPLDRSPSISWFATTALPDASDNSW